MNLIKLLDGLDYQIVEGTESIEINKIEYDSRNVREGDLFICISGFNTDGHKYAAKALENGAAAIVCEKPIDAITGCTAIMVKDTRKALALISSNFFNNPSRKIKLIGITGTNGKTTSTYMIKSILEEKGNKVGLVGTISNLIGDKKIPSHRTTPESLELHKLFMDMYSDGVSYCVMEVSSHSLELNRVYGIEFGEGIFTNLTQDHLDFHKTFENYFNAKLKLFENSNNVIVNLDDLYGRKIFDITSKNKITYSIETQSDVMARNITMTSRGAEFDISYKGESTRISLSIPGRYNIYNALGSAAVCLSEGFSLEEIKRGLEKVSVPGRCEIVSKKYNLDFEIIVDYAHTPDGLENILKTAREFTKGRLISVFGCGGDRDKTKRPIMGNIGSYLSDIAIITSDNPRTEDPEVIIEEIVNGVTKDNYVIIENRREAIKNAIKIAKKDDVIVIAGKGHEDYQILKCKTIHFDEREVIADIIKELF